MEAKDFSPFSQDQEMIITILLRKHFDYNCR